MNTLLIAESYPLVSESIARLLHQQHEFKLMGIYSTIEEINEQFHVQMPDFFIFDPQMENLDGMNYCSYLLKAKPDLKIILFTQEKNPFLLKKYFRLGVKAYLPKHADCREILNALQTVNTGQIYIHDSLQKNLSQWALGVPIPKQNQLTKREREVLSLIVEEYTTKEIAQKLFISFSTAETHRLRIIRKLGVKNTAGVVREAIYNNFFYNQ